MKVDIRFHSGRRKAISGILAGIIFFAMLFTAGLGFILFTFTSYNNYNQAQAKAIQDQQAKSAESLSLRSCDGNNNPLPSVAPWSPLKCTDWISSGDVGVWIQNTGGVGVTLVGMWILNSTKNSIVSGFSPTVNPKTPSFPSTINTGHVVTCSGSDCVVDTGFKPGSSTDAFSINFLTSTGNQFSATYPPPPLPNAYPMITLSPNSGPAGTTVTVTGVNFAHSSAVSLEFDGVPITATTPSSIVTNSGGSFSATFMVSSASTGSHTVSATDASSNSASAVFTVTGPTIILSPNGGPQGVTVTVTVSGSGFTPSSSSVPVTITFDSVTQTTSPTTVYTTSAGAFSATFSVSSTATLGPHTVIATDGSAQHLAASAIYTVTSTASLTTLPYITISPVLGPVGTTVTVTGANFKATTTVTITYDGVSKTTGTTDSGGSFTGVTFNVPTSVAGPHTVGATDGTNTAGAVFTVTSPTITLSPQVGNVGIAVTVNGGFFAATSTITIKFDNVVMTTSPGTVTTNSGGGFAGVTFNVPGTAIPGPHTVSAVDGSSNTATTVFDSIAPTITLSPLSGLGGDVVTITGGYFDPNSAVTIKFDGAIYPTTPPSFTTNAGGAFSGVTFTVPAGSTAGAHLVTATDALSATASATFLVNCATSNNCVAASAFGLGYISFDFNTFYFYTAGSCGNQGSGYPSTGCQLTSQGLAYTIPPAYKGGYLAFSVRFTNVDPNRRTLTFDDQSIMQAAVLCETSGCGSVTTPVWRIGTVNSANQVQPWNGSIRIAFGQTKVMWFIYDASTMPRPDFSKSCSGGLCFYETPIFFDVHGTICLTPPCGTTFGENLPFTTMYWPAGAAPGITLSPISGPSGTVVTVTGSGYAATSRITMKFDGAVVTTTPSTVTTSAGGSFSATFTVPASAAGSHLVTATDASSNTASATYTVT